MTLADLVRVHRAREGLTLQQLADRIDLSRAHVHSMENGKVINIGVISAARLAEALSLPLECVADAAVESASKR